MRKFWNFTANDKGERTLYLDGDIADESWGWGDEVTPKAFKEELLSGSGDVTIWINSPGGSVFAAAQIYNMLRDYPGKVTVKIDGIAASAASVVAMAGENTLMSPVSLMLIHNPSTAAFGDGDEMLRTKAMLDEVKESIINAYQAKSGQPREEISRMMTEVTSMNAHKAIKLGFADDILFESPVADISGSVKSYGLPSIKEYEWRRNAGNIGRVFMDNILELRDKRAKAWEAAQVFAEGARQRDGNGVMGAEDGAVYDKMVNDFNALGKEIERQEQAREITRGLSAPLNSPILNNPPPPEGFKTGRASDGYKKAFWAALRSARADRDPVIHNALSIGTDSEGGYLVPDEFERTLVAALEEHNIIRGLARRITTSSGDLRVPVVATRGTASWVDEAGTIADSDTTFAQVTLSAYKLATLIKVSRELLDDSAFPLESFLADDFGRRLGSLEEQAFISGDGTKKPTGVLVDAQVGATAASTATISFDDVIALYYSLRSPYRNKAVFITNDQTVMALRTIKSTDGQYIWQASVTAGTPDTILGRPLYVSGYVPAIAAGAKVLLFGDFSYYWIADRKGRSFERLNELFSVTDQIGFKATQRVDGRLILPEAVKVLQMGS